MTTRTVQLLGMPVQEYEQARLHSDALLREFALISFGQQTGEAELPVPARLLALVEELGHRFAGTDEAVQDGAHQAALQGRAVFDLSMELPVEAAEATEDLSRLFEEAEEYCRSGDLLVTETPPSVVAFRHWYLGQVVAQLRDGAPPTPFAAAPAGKASSAAMAGPGGSAGSAISRAPRS